MARQSTTKRITVADTVQIIRSCWRDEGVIVRHGGTEYGVSSVVNGTLVTWDGYDLDPRDCTIRKGTVEAIIAGRDGAILDRLEAINRKAANMRERIAATP